MRLERGRLTYLELFVLLVLFILNAGIALLYFYISPGAAFFSAAFVLSAIAFIIAYVLGRHSASRRDGSIDLLHALFSLSLFSYLMSFLTAGDAALGLAVKFIISLQSMGLWLVLLIPIFFLSFTSVYFLRKERRSNPAAKLALLAVVLLILILYYFVALKGIFTADDEELLKLTSVSMLLNGTNPYASSISLLLYQHTSTIGATLTTANTFLGTMDYPALFFLSFVPFYFAAQPVIGSLNTVYGPLQFSTFLFILIVAFTLLLRQRQLMRPQLTLMLVFVLAATELSSITTYLMLALLLIAYAKIESRYAWLPLGLCLSLQQELWLPVFLLFAYSFNNQGFGRGMRNAIGAAVVFLVFNAYFIAINPEAYFGSIFGTLNQLIMPFNPSPIAFLMLKSYQLPLTSYPVVFEALALLLGLAFLYLNRKPLIPLFGLLPFLVLDHILVSYYAFFLFFLLFALFTYDRENRAGWIEKRLREHRRGFFALLAIIALSTLIFVYASHSAYERNFSIGVVNQTLSVNRTSNTTVLDAQLVYSNMSNSTLYVFAFKYYGVSAGFSGLLNQSLISEPQACPGGNYTCLVNVNRIELASSSGTYPLRLTIHWSNASDEVKDVAVALYNRQYFYVADSVGASGA